MDSQQPGITDFLASEINSLGRTGARALLAHHQELADAYQDDPLWPEIKLFQHACRLSFNQGGDASEFLAALENYQNEGGDHRDPLWPALARHVARLSTPEDKALLEDLAQHPEKRDGRLGWCLQAFIRGDLMTVEGDWLLLDDFLKQMGVKPPPYLEEMPDELDFGEQSAETGE
ncbi:MAG: hypothetical protein HQL74_03575 [Magnetococcales bacterium]|nr:hypothetical protein [Magnetococcales bacterium]